MCPLFVFSLTPPESPIPPKKPTQAEPNLPWGTHQAEYHMGGIPKAGAYRKPIYSISPIIPYMASILQDRGLSYLSYLIYQPGGVSYGADTRRPEYAMALSNGIQQDTRQAEYRIVWAGYPPVGVYRNHIYSISPILSILSLLSPTLQDRGISYLSSRYTNRVEYPMDRIPRGRIAE